MAMTCDEIENNEVGTPAPRKSSARTDIHRPGAIVPADYEFVAYAYIKIEDLGDAMLLKAHREALAAHMARTGGTYSDHSHGGSCYICGAHAVYLCVFYHRPSNTYVKTGFECADKMDYDSGAGEAFRKSIKAAREAQTGKRKAQAVLSDAGLTAAWGVFSANYSDLAEANGNLPYEETVIRDIVGKLVQYGSVSENQLGFVRKLLDNVETRTERAAARAAEKEAAKPVPADMFDRRLTFVGEIVGSYSTDWGTNLVVKHADGWTAAGTPPRGIEWKRGDRVQFDAVLKPHRGDPKKAFWSRPTKPRILPA